MRNFLRDNLVAISQKKLPSRIAIYLHEVREPWLQPLEELCDYFLRNNYEFVLPEEYLDDAKGKKILITFDDAYQNWIKAAEVLNERGIRGTFYLTTGVFRDLASNSELSDFCSRINRVREETTLSVEEAKKIFEMGHRLGVHGHRHLNLSEVSEEEVRTEITRSYDKVSEITGGKPEDFAFTYGMPRYFPATALKVCRELELKRIAFGCGGLLRKPARAERIERTLWKLWEPLEYNLDSLRIDSRLFSFSGRDFTSDGKKMPSLY